MNTFATLSKTGKTIHASACNDRKTYPRSHFTCIDCREDVFVRRGQQRVWHFAHYSNDHERRCPNKNGGETLEHYEAKHWVAKNLHRLAFAVEQCPQCLCKKNFVGCGNVHVHTCVAEVERQIPGTNRVADVLVIDPKTYKTVAAIEVFHSHETGHDKRNECEAVGVAVLEVTTENINSARNDRNQINNQLLLNDLDTTDMNKNVECMECAMAKAFMEEWTKTVTLYSLLEEMSWHLLERQVLARRCMHNALEKIEECKFKRQKFLIHKKCVGKCKRCEHWMFQDQSLVTVASGTMPQSAWHFLFRNDHPKFKRGYIGGSIRVHPECAMECHGCREPALVHHLAVSGLCFKCDSQFNRIEMQ